MSKMALVVGIGFFVVAVVVFTCAQGIRRWYSGLFFVVLGTAILVNARRWQRASAGPPSQADDGGKPGDPAATSRP